MSGETLLRVGVTIIAVILILVHLIWPTIKIDGITLGLLALACLPWLAPLIKSIEIPGVGKLELQEIKQQAQEAKGAAQSAVQKADFALADTSNKNFSTQNENFNQKAAIDKLNELANSYNHIRETQPSSDARTSVMTFVMNEMVNLIPYLQEFEVTKALKESNGGKRLTAYAYLYVKPKFSLLDELVETLVSIEDKPFGQYWAIQALRKVIGIRLTEGINVDTLNKLYKFYKKLQPGTDRHYELARILKDINKNYRF